MHEVINGMMQREATLRMPVALIPGGTGNSFMEDLGLIHPRSAMESILGGSPQPIDLMECALDGAIEYAFNVCGWGMMASGNRRAESMRWMGRLRYLQPDCSKSWIAEATTLSWRSMARISRQNIT